MGNRKFLETIICAALFLCGDASALRPYLREVEAKASWMEVSSKEKKTVYYMEMVQGGRVILRTIEKGKPLTRGGAIKQQLVKDFFREIENSEIINSQKDLDSKMLFYKGEILKISAYVSGELRRVAAPFKDFGEAFSYAFSEVRKEALKLQKPENVKAFLMAEPLEGAVLDELGKRAGKEYEMAIIETNDIQKVKPLLRAIKQPHRLITLQSQQEQKSITDFITEHRLYGVKDMFYISTTRGGFRCQILSAE
ncbi:MAG: hypothetical protein HY746_00545 [Elusimicrobia bacterium]|nr:hypothetical protein [Elusimicrobiota bacterium]